MDELWLEQDDNPQAGDIPFLSRQVFDYNAAQVGYNDARRLVFFVRDRDNEIWGGICGYTYWGWLAVDMLWVHEDLRGRGWGTRLLQVAEEEAIGRGCRYALLDTMSFQAPGFYEKHNYVLYGVLEDFPGEHKRLYYQKRLETVDAGRPGAHASHSREV
jgi:ribosomal protein S18 acetylase RimI-like enzyme